MRKFGNRVFLANPRRFFEMVVVLGSLAGSGCAAQGTVEANASGDAVSSPAPEKKKKSAAMVVPVPTPEETAPFKLKPDWTGPCEKADKVDINLGHTPETFLRAISCQITGKEPSDAQLKQWSEKLVKGPNTRRIDVARTLCLQNSRRCEFTYSDPWESQPELGAAPEIKTQREIGAVLMFFFNCPAAVNCGMDWANTHAPGMAEKSPALAFEKAESAFYHPSEPGFWKRELEDAKYAGLSFLMPNTYGPDIEDGKLKPLQQALDSLQDPVKIALMDDTWTWGERWFSDFWKQKPRMSDTDKTAKLLYEAKWKPFFKQINKKHWYLFKGKPFIYFYNAGKLEPRDKSGAVLTKMKELFKADFGVEPYLAVDSAFFDDKSMPRVADQKFQWFTFQMPSKRSRSIMNGVTLDHAMVRWDAIGRDKPGGIAKPGDMLIKDDEQLSKVLKDSEDADLLILATWNDLGEGTGVNRNYDYYWNGKWQRPDYFIQKIRASQMKPGKAKAKDDK